jgi:hypothetical protein
VPVATLPLLSFVVGLLLAWSARARSSSRAMHGGWLVVAYTLLLHAPACATLLALNPDWSSSYATSPGRWQTAVVLCSSLASAGAVPLGYLLGGHRSRNRLSTPATWGALALLLVAANSLLFIEPLTRDASYVEYQNDFGVHGLAGSALGYSLIWAVVALGGALLFTHTHLRRLAQEHQALPALLSDSDA